MVLFESRCDEYLVESSNKSIAALKYKPMPRNNNILFSLRSITWPAYKASETAGITSDRPIKPIANGAFVKLYIHQPSKVVIMRNAITKTNLPATRFRNSGIRTDTKGEEF